MPFASILRRFPPFVLAVAIVTSSPAAQADLRLIMGGQARDVTTAENAAMTLDLTLAEDGPSQASGRFDGATLSGAFETEGGPIRPCRRGHVCLLFEGRLKAGDVTTPFALAVELKPGLQNAEGVYRGEPANDSSRAGRWGRFNAQSLAE